MCKLHQTWACQETCHRILHAESSSIFRRKRVVKTRVWSVCLVHLTNKSSFLHFCHSLQAATPELKQFMSGKQRANIDSPQARGEPGEQGPPVIIFSFNLHFHHPHCHVENYWRRRTRPGSLRKLFPSTVASQFLCKQHILKDWNISAWTKVFQSIFNQYPFLVCAEWWIGIWHCEILCLTCTLKTFRSGAPHNALNCLSIHFQKGFLYDQWWTFFLQYHWCNNNIAAGITTLCAYTGTARTWWSSWQRWRCSKWTNSQKITNEWSWLVSEQCNTVSFSPLPLTHTRTQNLVWVPWCDSRNRASQYPIDRSCLMAEKSRQSASRIARLKKTKTGWERHEERESERREDRVTKRGRTRKTSRCYQSKQ